MKITNKTFFESLDNVNENAYGFSQMANTWVAEDQLIFAFALTPKDGPVVANLQVSPSIRHQDYEHGDNFDFEYFDRRDLSARAHRHARRPAHDGHARPGAVLQSHQGPLHRLRRSRCWATSRSGRS